MSLAVVEQGLGRNDAVDEPEFQRRCGIDHLTGEQHFHRALARDVARQATAGVEQNRPTSMPLTPKLDRSEAIARSQDATSWQPAAVAMPSTSRDHRFGMLDDRLHQARAERRRSCSKECLAKIGIGAMGGHLLEVVAGGKQLPSRGDDDDPGRIVVTGCLELGLKRFHQLDRQRVRGRIAKRQAEDRALIRFASIKPLPVDSDRLQRVGEVGDEVVGILAADRNPDQVGGDVELLLALVGHRQMGHRRGRAGERLGAAEADREIGDLQRVEEGERLLLAALQVEREGRAGAGAMALVDVRLARAFLEEAEIADLLDLRVAA